MDLITTTVEKAIYRNDVSCYFKKKVGYTENDFLLLTF